jgi:peptidyl-prolyl cis-trans isomerase B (cyclophilin B)
MSNQSSSSPKPSRSSGTNNAVVLIAAVAVVAVIAGIVAIGLLVGNSSGTNGAAQRDAPKPPPVTTQAPAGHTITPPQNTPSTPAQTNLPALTCSKPPALPAKPQHFAKPPSKALAENATWEATVTTNCGPIVIDLDGKAAPQTVASFLFLAQQKYFDDVPCHRLVPSGIFVLQCGDPTGTGSGGPGYGFGMENAPPNGDYPPGTVAMARTSDPNSNGSQFFIVYQDSTIQDPTGYSIFGNVVKGLDIVRAIAARGLASDGVAPKQPVSILHVSVKKL